MPHKHTRKGMADKTTVDLPPSEIAKPLSVSKAASSNGIFTTDLAAKRNNNKRKRKADPNDDTPKAFARLMAFQRGEKLPKGLDDGIRAAKKKQKLAQAKDKDNEDGAASVLDKKQKKEKEKVVVEREIPTIRPGERMSDFNVRVDAALPVSGLINKTARGGKDPLGLKVGRTKTERRMHKMYDEWREQEKKIQDKRLDDLEAAEEDEMGEDETGRVRWKADIEAEAETGTGNGKKKKKAKGKKKVIGEVDVGDKDPWAKIKRDRGEVKAGLHDVVLAPPTFTKVPREKFKVRGAGVEVGDVPKASGSLRRREELEVERRSVVEGYRAMMKANKGKKDD